MMVMSTICSMVSREFGSKLYRSRVRDGAVKGSPKSLNQGDAEGRPRLVAAAAAGAAGTVSGRHRVGRDLVLRLEGTAAAACRHNIRVLDLEPGAHQPVDVVDARALQVGQAEPVDDHSHPVVLPRLVVVLGGRVEAERVLES